MDRHDVSESVTAEHVALLHQEDLKVQDSFGCRGLTYWFDDKRKTAFCLVEAPNEQAIREMHDHAHGKVPHSIIEVDAGVVESFLGRIEDPGQKQASTLKIIDDPAFRTIMVIEKEASFLQNSEIGDLSGLLKSYYEAVRLLINDHSGRLVKENEDHLLVSFESVSGAVTTALAIKDKSHEPDFEKISLKMGLSAGLPVTDKKSIFEDTINLAKRICAVVPGELIVSTDVTALCSSEDLDALLKASETVVLATDDQLFITQLMDFMDSDWADSELQVNDFSRPVGLSKSQCYRKLKVLTGKSPNIFLKDYRLKRALELLTKKMSNVSEVAFLTGFTSPSYFSKCFQKKYGHSPSEYLPANSHSASF
jgi:AraC-like DNA-binding protein